MSPVARTLPLLAVVVLGASMAAAACTSAPATTGAAPQRAAAGAGNVLTAAEIESRGMLDGSALSTIQRLRPGFLNYRGAGNVRGAGKTQVSLDGGALTDVATLRNLGARQVAEVRYLGASDAAQRFGLNANSGPVILVKLK